MADTLTNLLLNVDCLDLLERLPSDMIDLTYIDPPWPVSPTVKFGASDFKVSEWESELIQSINVYLDFLEIRLRHAHRILKESGSIIIHTSSGITRDIQILLDTIFGLNNYIAEYVLPRQKLTNIGSKHSLLIVYGKTRKAVHHQLRRPLLETETGNKHKRDELGRTYRLSSLIRPDDGRSTLRYEWKGVFPPNNSRWIYSQEKMQELDEQGLIIHVDTSGLPRLKQYLDDIQVPIGSTWDDISNRVKKDESTGFVSQQSLSLLERVIQLATNEDDIVVDPFCGSGTSLVAAHQLGRRWIGCDLSQEAYHLSLERLESTYKLQREKDFRSGGEKELRQMLPQRWTPSNNNIASLWVRKRGGESGSTETPSEYIAGPEAIKPIIITEGKTDWKHLKAALEGLLSLGRIDKNLNLDFHEREDPVGEKRLLSELEADARFPQSQLHIYVFDSDNFDTVKKVSSDEEGYRKWNDNVYSMALLVPEHRKNSTGVSIEMYYKDEDLRRLDESGRRLFLSNEFHPESGRHLADSRLSCRELGKIKGSLKIIDQYVYNEAHDNKALSKDDYAENILSRKDGFDDLDWTAFIAIFELINRIIDDARNG